MLRSPCYYITDTRGFEPPTASLEDWYSIQTELCVQCEGDGLLWVGSPSHPTCPVFGQ